MLIVSIACAAGDGGGDADGELEGTDDDQAVLQEMVTMLLDAGADPTLANSSGITALTQCATNHWNLLVPVRGNCSATVVLP